jgi:peroxiredoxin
MLNPGDVFPTLSVDIAGRAAVRLPDALAGSFGVVLILLGAWCPYCNAQLRSFQRAQDRLANADIKVFALSVDDAATTQDLIANHGLTFPVGYGADAPHIADLTGAFVNPEPEYLQSTGFVLDPNGTVLVSVYSSGAIGRLVPGDVLGFVAYLRNNSSAA